MREEWQEQFNEEFEAWVEGLTYELAVAFLAEQLEEAMADGGFQSSPHVSADGTISLRWFKPGGESRGVVSN